MTLIEKIAKAALEVGGRLSADKTNTEQRYDYISADKILSECGQALFGQGVVVMPEMAGQETTLYEYTDQYGKARKRYDSRVDFVFRVSDGETSIEHLWFGMGSDYVVPDKALYKAVTSGHKYFLMKLLCIGAGNEDGEHEPESVGRPAEGKDTPKKQPAKQGNGKPAQPSLVELTMEEALEVVNSQGAKYGEIATETLANMANSIQRAMDSGKTKDEHLRKLEAIKLILKSRAETA